MKIPIRNLYYLFCYAWERYPKAEDKDLGVEGAPNVQDLLARLFIDGIHRLLRRGLDRSYLSYIEETRAPRGKILMDEVIKTQTLRRGAVVCAFDELSVDVLHNQILKATARILSRVKLVAPEHARDVGTIAQRMQGVSDVRLDSLMFSRIQLGRNNRHYKPLLRLCEFIFRGQIPDQSGLGIQFADILEDEKLMSAVFEDFLRNFYTYEQSNYRVAREMMAWDAEPLIEGSSGVLPMMETDITMRSRERTIVMDAKYYKEMLASRSGPSKIRSSHLYQLFAYLEHAGLRSRELPCDGALIYPAVGDVRELRYRLRGHEVVVRSIDLSAPWPAIHDVLLTIPLSFGRPQTSPDLTLSASMQ